MLFKELLKEAADGDEQALGTLYTGHSSAKLVTDTYAHIQVDSRKALADSLEKDFYKKKDTEKSAEEKNPVDVAGLMNLIKENPELKNFLLASVLADESMKVQQMQN